MTLHMAFVSGASVVQVGDRLLTVGKGRPWDAAANKTVIVEALNGRVVIGYAGLAHVGGEPTGEWLLRKITGSSTPYTGFQSGGLEAIHLGELRRRIVTGIENEFVRAQNGLKKQKIEVLVSGWAFPRIPRNSKRPSAFSYSLSHSGVPGARCKFSSVFRYRYQDPSPKWGISAIGRGDLLDLGTVHARFLSLGKASFDTDDVEAAFVSVIRSIADVPESGVGSNVMSVFLSALPQVHPPHVRYFRDARVTTEHVGYAPALVAPGLVSPSAEMTASSGMSVVFDADTALEWQYKMETIPGWTTIGVRSFRTHSGKRWPR